MDSLLKLKIQHYARQIVTTAGNLAPIAAKALPRDHPVNQTLFGAKVIDEILDNFVSITIFPFNEEGWERFPIDHNVLDTVKDIIWEESFELSFKPCKETSYRLFSYNDVVFGFEFYKLSFEDVYVYKTPPETARKAIADLIWNTYGNKLSLEQDSRSREFQLKSDFFTDYKPSSLGDEIVVKSRMYRDAGINRAILLYGQPGTGKSYMARYIIHELGAKSLRVSMRDLHNMRDILYIFEVLNCDGLIIDDIDRASSQKTLIEILEELKLVCSLIILTANNYKVFDPALCRPGRIDEFIEVDQICDAVIESDYSHLSPQILEAFRDKPVAYLEEISRRVSVVGEAQAIREMTELLKRRNEIQDHYIERQEDRKVKRKGRGRS